MKGAMMKKIIPLLLAVIISVLVTYTGVASVEISRISEGKIAQNELDIAIIPQSIIGSSSMLQNVTKVYENGRLIGVLNNPEVIDQLLVDIYEYSYSTDFPNSKVGLDEDIFLVEEPSYYLYSDVDSEIVNYIAENDLFSVESYKIEFSNGAVIFVSNLEDFEKAKEQYILNFISPEAYELIRNKKDIPELVGYGYRETNINVLETTVVSRGLASKSSILKNQNEIVYFLSYGYGTDIDTYKVVEYDTVEGVGSKTGLTAQQIVTINADKIKSLNQVLQVGMELNVTYFNSPINVVVTREQRTKEVVYPPSTQYVNDPTLREGLRRVVVAEKNGSKDVVYRETYINGVLVKGEQISSVVTVQPVREVVHVGTKVIPGIGSGNFRWPVDSPRITCGWYCYSGHQAIDIASRYNRFGNIYAADRGVVVQNGYHYISGYYVIIDHQNGFRTYYGHMASRGYYPVGVAVEKGEIIGRIGLTGYTTGPHVHFEIHVNRVKVNPCRYMGC